MGVRLQIHVDCGQCWCLCCQTVAVQWRGFRSLCALLLLIACESSPTIAVLLVSNILGIGMALP